MIYDIDTWYTWYKYTHFKVLIFFLVSFYLTGCIIRQVISQKPKMSGRTVFSSIKLTGATIHGQSKYFDKTWSYDVVFSFMWPAPIIHAYCSEQKKVFSKEKRVESPLDWFRTPTWRPSCCFGTPVWLSWRHVKTLWRKCASTCFPALVCTGGNFSRQSQVPICGSVVRLYQRLKKQVNSENRTGIMEAWPATDFLHLPNNQDASIKLSCQRLPPA